MIRSLLALAALLVLATAADAADADLPPLPVASICDDPRVLHHIAERFAWAEHNTWRTGLEVTDFDQVDFQAGPAAEPIGLVDRAYCRARAYISDGTTEPVYYVIAHPLGFAGFGSGVEFCLPHYDRWHVYGAACRSLKP